MRFGIDRPLKAPQVYGVVGEFQAPEDLVDAAKVVRKEGYTRTDALSPFPVHGIDDALGIPRSNLGYLCLVAGGIGTATAVGLIWYTGVLAYPLVIGGKPLFSVVPSVPIMFELTVLFAAFAAVFGMIGVNKLPTFYHPTMNYSRFESSSDDKFLLIIEAADPKFDAEGTRKLLVSLGAANVEVVEE